MTSLSSWDPLNNSENIDQAVLSSAKKRGIKNILKSYVGIFDPFAELIQNSMDAVDKRSKIESDESNYNKTLWIEVDIAKNMFSITDNGIGFNESEFRNFLAPSISFKNEGKTRGNKGVGATYIGYGFNHLSMGTKSPDFSSYGKLVGGRDWVEDRDGIVTNAVVKGSKVVHQVFNTIDRGSSFTIKFGGSKTRPKDLSYFAAGTVDQWLYLLLIKTPLGGIHLSNQDVTNDKDIIKFNLTVIDKHGNKTAVTDQEANYIYPHSKISASVDVKHILAAQKKLIEDGKDASKLPGKYSRLNGIYEFFSVEEVKELPTRSIKEDEIELIDQYSIEAYGFFTYSTKVWDQLSDKGAKLRKGTRILRGGLQLANNYMPQGDIIAIPLTSNIGYQNQAHVIVHFKNADPDLGRKGFQPELKELAQDISVGIVNRFKKWRSQLKRDTGATPDIKREIDLHKWLRNQEEHEINSPLVLTNPAFFNPVNEISISSTPQSEQDAIVLFNQLIAGGVIRGIKLLATSQSKQYDGIFKYVINPPESIHLFEKATNPLGVDTIQVPLGTVTPLKVLEYKLDVDALIREFESEEKKEKDINLVVAWSIGTLWKRSYEVTSLLDLDNLHHRPYHGLTHIFQSQNTQFYAIILEELINYLNDTDGVQEFQVKSYGGDQLLM